MKLGPMVAAGIAAGFFVSAAAAAPRAVVFGVWGNVPGTPLEEMTDAWRQAAAKVAGFDWVPFTKSLTDVKAEPGCAGFAPACRGRIAKEIGADVLFFAKHAPWGGAFEQMDVKTGTTTRKARIAFEAEGEELTAAFRDAGVKFVKGGVSETAAAAVAAAPAAAVPAPIAPAKPATPTPPATPAVPPKPATPPTPVPAATKAAAPPPVPAPQPAPTTPAPKPGGSSPSAVVLGYFGTVPGAPLQAMTDAWREAAARIAGYRWVPFAKTPTEIQAIPACAKMGPACRAQLAKEAGADVMFFARHQPWGGAFEQVDVASGTTVRKARIGFEGRGDKLIAGARDAGAKFVTDGAPAQPAGAVAVIPVVPPAAPPSPAAAPAPPAKPPAPAASPSAASPPASAQAKAPPPKPEPPAPATQLIDPEISRKPAPAATEVEAAKQAAPEGPSLLSRVRLRTWFAAGAAVALLGTGTVFALRSQNAEDDLNDPARGCETTTQLAACQDLEDKARTRALIANVLFAAGGAAAIGTGALLYLDLRDGGATAGAAVKF
jgi:hypothetical protein